MDQEPNIVNTKKEKSKKDSRDIDWIQGIILILAITLSIIAFISYTNSAGSFEVENRAYVYVQSIYLANMYEPFFEIKFKNYGKTPAKEIKLSQVRVYSEEGLNLDSSIKMDSTEFALLVPDGELSHRISSNVPYYTIAEQHGKVYIVGKINYKDNFDETHTTQFAGWLGAHGDNQFLRLQGILNNSD